MPKLTKNDVIEIKHLFNLKEEGLKEAESTLRKGRMILNEAKKLTTQRIANEYGVSKAAIQKIKEGENWVWIK